MSAKSCIAENKTLNIIHFNDVYNITEDSKAEKCGGVARFMTVINKLKSLSPPPLTFFSGDFLSPSIISTITKGEHMIQTMNLIGITCGMIGNHDLDYGNEHCIQCLSKLNYPTLNSNIFTLRDKNREDDRKNDEFDDEDDDMDINYESYLEPLGKCKQQLIIHDYYGFNIGIIGVAEDWCNTIPIKPKNGIIYKDFIQQCSAYITRIKKENDLNFIIVLTHSRKENDILLANKIKGIDLILGGHDHLYYIEMNKINKSLLVKSGCDFKGLTYIKLQQKENKGYIDSKNELILSELNPICLTDLNQNLIGLNYNYTTYHYTINNKITPNVKMFNIVNKLSKKFLSEIEKPIGFINCDLDTRFKIIRKCESASCNLICDIVRHAHKCDVVLLCGGGIRSDKIHKTGIFTYKDILDLVPFQDPVIVKKIIGKNIIAAIKHSILNLPKLDGRFAHVSGLKYIYNSSKKPSERLVDIKINIYGNNNAFDKYVDIEPDKYYTVASRQYTMNGGDGFDCLNGKNNQIVVDADSGFPLSTLLRNFFWAASAINDNIKLMQNNNDKKSLLKIKPTIEGRVVDIAEHNNCSLINVSNKNYINYINNNNVLWSEINDKFPSFVNMTYKPKPKALIMTFATNLEH